jgi:hypothetical protein
VLGQALARRRDQRLGIVDREARAQFRVRVGERVHTGHVEPSDLVRVAERAQRTTAQVERARRTAPLLAFGQHVDQTVDPDRVLVAPAGRTEALLGVFAVNAFEREFARPVVDLVLVAVARHRSRSSSFATNSSMSMVPMAFGWMVTSTSGGPPKPMR